VSPAQQTPTPVNVKYPTQNKHICSKVHNYEVTINYVMLEKEYNIYLTAQMGK